MLAVLVQAVVAVPSTVPRQTYLGRNLRVLEKDGLVRLSQGKDERTRVPVLTADAKRALRIAQPLWEETQKTIASTLPHDAKQHLQKISNALEQLH